MDATRIKAALAKAADAVEKNDKGHLAAGLADAAGALAELEEFGDSVAEALREADARIAAIERRVAALETRVPAV